MLWMQQKVRDSVSKCQCRPDASHNIAPLSFVLKITTPVIAAKLQVSFILQTRALCLMLFVTWNLFAFSWVVLQSHGGGDFGETLVAFYP